jgi:DMSO reductase anchor subunit
VRPKSPAEIDEQLTVESTHQTIEAMAALKDKIETALNEARILILGGQVLAGIQFRIFFEGDFQHVPLGYQRILFAGLAALLLGLAFLMAPASYHTIVEKHRDTVHLYHFTALMLAIGLLPFAISLGTTMLVTVHHLSTANTSIAAALISCLLCLVLWYGFPLFERWRKKHSFSLFPVTEVSMEKPQARDSAEMLSGEVKEVLLEARMVLPGAQALLGFQFINVWLEGFNSISQPMKLAHFASLCSVAVSTILLMMPAAYHRIAEAGEDTRQFVTFAGRMLLVAMVFLAVGICGDFLVVAVKLQFSLAASVAMSSVLLAVFLGLWFGYTLWKRAQLAKMK